MPNSNTTDNALLLRLDAFEAEKKIRQCMLKYMGLCDYLGVNTDVNEIAELFAHDAVWQGKGNRYAKTFGRYEGSDAIGGMFATYTKPPAHFEMNAHFMCNELIYVDSSNTTAQGSWMLIQPSSFSSGKSQLSCARITAEFGLTDGAWLIKVFTTENIFSRPMTDPWDNSASLSVPTKNS